LCASPIWHISNRQAKKGGIKVAEEMVNAPMDSEEVTSDDKLWALLSYIFCPLIGIIVLLIEDKKDRPFLRYNAVVSIIMGILVAVLSWACIGLLVWFYSIYLGFQAYQGQWVEVPVISDLVRNQGWA
jgi:uncharacterized membrane protein